MSLTIKLHSSSTTYLSFGSRFRGYNPRIRPNSIYHFNPLTVPSYQSNKMQASLQSSPSSVFKSSLIEPDGGVLVDLAVPESEREAKTVEAESLPKVRLTKIVVEWLHVIGEGWASPLKGFMLQTF
ncbi:hypothetical protein GQ457_03G038270 [Hibiscus cannabinus]